MIVYLTSELFKPVLLEVLFTSNKNYVFFHNKGFTCFCYVHWARKKLFEKVLMILCFDDSSNCSNLIHFMSRLCFLVCKCL